MEQITNEQLLQALQSVSDRTNSELVRFFVVMAVVIIVFIAAGLIVYPKILKNTESRENAESKADEKKLDAYIKREALIIDVVQKNTEAITSLKAVLDTNTKHCDVCKIEQLARFDALGNKIDQNTYLMTRIVSITDTK